ncbi:MAG: DNA transformation protein [Paracoccaceae bacterium]
MSEPVSSIRNLGPAADISYGRAGITSAQQLRDIGADAAYGLMLAHGGQAHFIGFYALVLGLQGRPWNDCQGAEKKQLRQRFDTLKTSVASADQSLSAIDVALHEIGVIKRG